MGLRLLVDEDSQDKLLMALFTDAGHDVLTVGDLSLLGQSDGVVLERAVVENRVLLTGNCDDFAILSAEWISRGRHYPGILLIRRYNNPRKDMSYREIVQAIANFEAHMNETGILLADLAVSLVKYRY